MADLKTETPLETLKRIERTEYSNSHDTMKAIDEINAVYPQLTSNFDKALYDKVLSRLGRWYLGFKEQEKATSSK